MKITKYSTAIALTFLLFLGACSNSTEPTETPTTETSTTESTTTESTAPETTTTTETDDHSAPAQGGQVLEVGAYHLEFVAAPEGTGTHLDLFLQTGDTHEAIADAVVKAQVQLPDGSQKEVDLTYDAEGKHYAGLLPEAAAGDYQVAILTEIKGEKVNGRFNFTK